MHRYGSDAAHRAHYAATEAECVTECASCDALREDNVKCSVGGCEFRYCDRCAWQCEACSAVICGTHAEVVSEFHFCPRCAPAEREYAAKIALLESGKCPDCLAEVNYRDIGTALIACCPCGFDATNPMKPRSQRALRPTPQTETECPY